MTASNAFSDERARESSCCPIVELRQYTLHPGKRDVLIDLFDREFVETQEAVGMKVIGQFRDLDDPDRFVWLRGFRDMPSRAQALSAFYGGPVWKAYRDAANATMIDSDNVLLLHPASQRSGFSLENSTRLPINAGEIPKGFFTATIYYLNMPADDDFTDFFDHMLKPELTKLGAEILACFATEDSPNTFPALPVREGEQVFIWFARFQDQAAYELYTANLSQSRQWRGQISDAFSQRTKRLPEVLKLTPTTRSLLHG
jgi:quinol monooxygenase YgiN